MLPELIAEEAFQLLLIFASAAPSWVMPGLAEAHVPGRVRLFLAIGLSIALTGPLAPTRPCVRTSRARALHGVVELGAEVLPLTAVRLPR